MRKTARITPDVTKSKTPDTYIERVGWAPTKVPEHRGLIAYAKALTPLRTPRDSPCMEALTPFEIRVLEAGETKATK